MIVSVKDGKTPYIGANGNWWIGATDTGVKAEYIEADPTVPAWAKEPSKPTYTASEVGADASGAAASALASAKAYADGIKPTKTSQLTNDSGFITGYTETDPTVPAWAKAPSKPTYTASEVGAAPAGYGYGGVIPLISCSELGYTAWSQLEAKLTEYVNILKAGESMQLRISFYPLTSAGNVFICKLFRHDNSIYANLSGESYTGERFNKSMYANVWNPIVWMTPPLQFGTADVTAGSASTYPEGTLYVVIE